LGVSSPSKRVARRVVDFPNYAAGTWGPDAADAMLAAAATLENRDSCRASRENPQDLAELWVTHGKQEAGVEAQGVSAPAP